MTSSNKLIEQASEAIVAGEYFIPVTTLKLKNGITAGHPRYGTASCLTLYVHPDATRGGDTALRYALSGNTGRDDMLRLAKLVYQQRPK